jgi:hypothetical protein
MQLTAILTQSLDDIGAPSEMRAHAPRSPSPRENPLSRARVPSRDIWMCTPRNVCANVPIARGPPRVPVPPLWAAAEAAPTNQDLDVLRDKRFATSKPLQVSCAHGYTHMYVCDRGPPLRMAHPGPLRQPHFESRQGGKAATGLSKPRYFPMAV